MRSSLNTARSINLNKETSLSIYSS
jgi:hypothetical protein